jgi:hypothetical protein
MTTYNEEKAIMAGLFQVFLPGIRLDGPRKTTRNVGFTADAPVET